MNPIAYIVALAITAGLWSGPPNTTPQNSQTKEAGHVLEIKCSAYLKKPNHAKQPRLDPRRDKDLPLYAQDEVKCVGDGYLKLEIYGRTFNLNQSHGWYPIPEKSTGDDNAPGPGRVGALKGTYRLYFAGTRNPDSVAMSQVPNEWKRSLEIPAEMAIELNGTTVTIASSMFPRFSFEADGREYQLVTSGGKTFKLRALIEDEQVIVKSSTDISRTFEAVFSPRANGELKVIRRVYVSDNQPPAVTEATYHRTSDLARFDVYSHPGSRRNAPDRDFLSKEDDSLVAELNEHLSSSSAKTGDEFSLTVRQPAKYEGATVKGHISRVQRSNKRAQLALRFDSIHLANGKSYHFTGTLEQVRDADLNSDQNAEMGRSGVGAIIGAITGGGKGAAIGAGIGGSRSTGSVYSRSTGGLELRKGTEITIGSVRFGRKI